MIRAKRNPKLETKNRHGAANGFLVPIFNVIEGFVAPAQRPEQVYLTVVWPGEVKGPHLHKKRWGLFTCVKGNLKIVVRAGDGYEEHFSGQDYGYASVQVPAGVACALVNVGTEDAYVLNMPAPAWRQDDQDEHPVSFDDYEFKSSRDHKT